MAKRTPDPVVVFKFKNSNASLPVAEVERQRLYEAARAFTSDDAAQRQWGRQRLDEVAALAARGRISVFKNRNADKARVVTPAQEERIRKQFAQRVADGEKYGSIKALAAAHGLAEKTVSTIVAAGKNRK